MFLITIFFNWKNHNNLKQEMACNFYIHKNKLVGDTIYFIFYILFYSMSKISKFSVCVCRGGGVKNKYLM